MRHSWLDSEHVVKEKQEAADSVAAADEMPSMAILKEADVRQFLALRLVTLTFFCIALSG